MPYASKEKQREYQKKYKEDRVSYFKEYRTGEHYKSLCKKYYFRKKITGLAQALRYVRKATVSGLLKSLTTNNIKCSFCDNRATVYDHRDYNKPLDVIPVCKSCNWSLGKAIPVCQ